MTPEPAAVLEAAREIAGAFTDAIYQSAMSDETDPDAGVKAIAKVLATYAAAQREEAVKEAVSHYPLCQGDYKLVVERARLAESVCADLRAHLAASEAAREQARVAMSEAATFIRDIIGGERVLSHHEIDGDALVRKLSTLLTPGAAAPGA